MTDLDILLRLESKVDVLNERMDRHENKNDVRFAQVFQKLDNAAEKVHQVELDGVRESGMTNAKVAGLTGFISIIVSFLTAWFTDKIAR